MSQGPPTHDPNEPPGGTPAELDRGWEEGEDPVLVSIVRKALAPYVGRVPPERLVEYRRLVILFITTHPAMATRYERVRTRPVVVAASTTVTKDDALGLDQPVGDAIRGKVGG